MTCSATADGMTIYRSPDAQALRDAIAAAPVGATVKIAGTCAGSVAQANLSQVVLITKQLTLRGGYTDTVNGWQLPYPLTQPTMIDALASGRVIYATQPLTVEDLIVQNGRAIDANGGGLYINGDLRLIGSDIRNSVVTGIDLNNTGSGGGVYVVGSAMVTQTDFFSNTAALSGGGLYVSGALTITGSDFVSNTANGGGGAFVIGDATMTATSFLANTAASDGGGASVFGMTSLVDTNFVTNTASGGDGGGLNVNNKTTISSAHFFHNSAGAYGGGLSAPYATLTKTTFVSNTALLGGGAYIDAALFAASTDFLDNKADVGGGAYVGMLAHVTAGHFIGNRAKDGGGARIDMSGYFTATQFLNNYASDSGGGISINATAMLTGTQLLSNTAGLYGGGAWFYGPATVRRATFLWNEANAGGALYLAGYSDTPQFVVNSIFAGNRAVSTQGNTLYLEDTFPNSELILVHNTLANPTSFPGSALYIKAWTVAITNTIFAGHTVAINNRTGIINENNNLFYGNSFDQLGAVNSSVRHYTGEPAFVDAPNGDYRLTRGSAAINQAIATNVNDDFEAQARPQQGHPDIGADEAPYVLPSLSIGNGYVVEGNQGVVTLTLPLTLSFAKAVTVTVLYSTEDHTALIADLDYGKRSEQMIVFPPGQLTQTIALPVYGDSQVEDDETFIVYLRAPTFAVLGKDEAQGLILNDDRELATTPTPTATAETTPTTTPISTSTGAVTPMPTATPTITPLVTATVTPLSTPVLTSTATPIVEDSPADLSTLYLPLIRSQ